ncbi:MAG: hypothetical protein U9P71_06345 [Campylobacterota bacterium]|nr:hypothetical protein [Campylobacterota bacterium]
MKLPIKRKNTKGIKTLFIDKNSTFTGGEQERLNIVLSPSYYWFKRVELPVKYVSQAQSLAASQFDGVIPEANYKYMVIKKEDLFWLFAYDEAVIAQKLKNLNIKPSQIEGFYFAQNECEALSIPIKIDENMALVNSDGVVSLMPISYVNETLSLEQWSRDLNFSKHKVSLNLFQNSVLDEKWIFRFSVMSIVFIVLYLASYLLLKNDLKNELTQQYALTQKYKLPETSFQLNSLKRSLTSKENRQIELRQNVKKLFSIRLEKGEYVKKFEMKTKTVEYEIVLNAPKNAEKIKKQLSKNFKVDSAKVVDNTFYVGVKL